MFRYGDKIVCIYGNLFDENRKLVLKKYQTCTFKKYYSLVPYDYSFSTIIVNNNEYTYVSSFFISLKEYRRQKMKKIFKNKNI